MSTTGSKEPNLVFNQFKTETRRRLSLVVRAMVSTVRFLPSSFRLFGIPKRIHTCKDFNATPIYPKILIEREKPKTINTEIHWRFTRDLDEEERRSTPEVFIVSLEQGISTNIGANLDKLGTLIPEVSKQFDLRKGENHKITRSPKILPKIQHFATSVATIAFEGQNNYFHWVLDALPQFHLLGKADIKPEKLYVEYQNRFQKETLSILGYQENQIINSKQFPYISATELIVPSFPGKSGYTPAWVCQFLRETFFPHQDKGTLELPDAAYKRIYLSRRSATRRRILNETALINFLEPYGFIEVQTDQMSFLDQVRLFNNVEMIVAPHGAGLTNLVFCDPGTQVIELFSPHYVNGCFWTLCEQLGLHYYYLIGEGDPPPKYYDSRCVTDDIEVSLDKLGKTFELIEFPP